MSQATITRDQVAPVALPAQAVDVAAIGGAVMVRGMTLPQVLEFSAARRAAAGPQDGETPEQAATRAGGTLLPLVLHQCVGLDDGLPVYSQAEWGAFAVQHPQPAFELWQVAMRLSGQLADEEKKT
jgi:hypothetical protein